MALALYRRYRPDTFEGVIGQDQVTVPIMRALDEHKLTHAYLFSGPRGCGKTSSARILARCVNCVKGPTSHPCGECDSCRDLATGGPGSIDVVEIDAASHNGVDDARELRERAGFAPARDRYKIFILDEAHMVTPQGFNALLKIVEEPPEHVMFIFATTEPEKVIGTIRSRTHHYPFRLVPPETMGPYLEQICEQEHIETEPGVLRLAMRAGGGSVRDTLSVLDQLMVGAVDGDITYDSAVALLGFTPDVLIGAAIDAVIDHDGAKLYDVIQKVIVGGYDARRFVEDLLARIRDLLVLTLGGDHAERVLSDDAAVEDLDDLHRQAKALGLATLTAMAEETDEALTHMAGATSPRMRLELLAARLLAGRETGYAALGDREPGASAQPDPTKPAAVGGFIGSDANAAAGHGQPSASHMQPASQMNATVAPQNAPTGAQPSVQAVQAAQPAQPAVQGAPQSREQAHQSKEQHAMDAAAAAMHAASQAQRLAEAGAQPQPAPLNGTPDELWDALVASLPDDVRAYVDRTKVPRIKFAPDRRTGGRKLMIKFGTPMDKYAFALAVSKESVDGSTEVTDILRAEVHRVFGPDVRLAPTPTMEDGQTAPPFKHLPPDQQQRIKAQLAKENLQATLRTQLGRASGEQPAAAPSSGDDAQAADDAVHRGGSAQPHAADYDPWANPKPATEPFSAPSDMSAASRTSQSQTAPSTQTPANRAAAAQPMMPNASQTPPAQGAVAHPPLTMPSPNGAAASMTEAGIDPWAYRDDEPAHIDFNRVSSIEQQAAQDRRNQPAAPADPWSHLNDAPQAAAETAPGMQPMQQQPAQPQVDPEEDEYSINDESLASSQTMSIDEVKELFDVKSVEEFAADDPKNPRNQQAH
ncbi:DNA polymerase III subunit gamma/tau [Bifidobacterium choerinum]|uniref:DNA-directed DNA polymerase n=1 Tax=Bifidobacterium choerinum TaxID=35760 RepID=A0A087AHB8_9BIFI|nr:DNA polymerase III subunit gamma/tau [Bifidobacterium choerinum]KFI58168.1 DNA polymerase III subunit gamma/tau [Bifidobacterium choerinum]